MLAVLHSLGAPRVHNEPNGLKGYLAFEAKVVHAKDVRKCARVGEEDGHSFRVKLLVGTMMIKRRERKSGKGERTQRQ